MVVDFFRLEQRGSWLIAHQNSLHHNHEAHCRQALTRDEDESVDGRNPMRVERHHPIDHCEGNRECIQDQTRRGDFAETRAQVLHRRRVLLGGPATQDESDAKPDGEINNRPADVAIEKKKLCRAAGG